MHLHSANAQPLQESEGAHNPKQCIAFTISGRGRGGWGEMSSNVFASHKTSDV